MLFVADPSQRFEYNLVTNELYYVYARYLTPSESTCLQNLYWQTRILKLPAVAFVLVVKMRLTVVVKLCALVYDD